jgi:hypothetical protein
LNVRHKLPDKKHAKSLLEAAERDIRFTLKLKIDAESGSTIVRNIYECFRKIGEASLIARGIKVEDHIRPINELVSMPVKTQRPVQTIANLRALRHNINYRGYQPNLDEVEDAVDIAKSCFDSLLQFIEGKIK